MKGDPKHTVPVPYHEPCGNATHTVLRVQKPYTSGPKWTSGSVNIFNGSKVIQITVKCDDTIGKLQQELLKLLKPNLGNDLNLVFNGKLVQQQQTMSELQVKPGATFLTVQKCHGG